MTAILLDATTLIYLAKSGGIDALNALNSSGQPIYITDVVRSEATKFRDKYEDGAIIQLFIIDQEANLNSNFHVESNKIGTQVLNGTISKNHAGEKSLIELQSEIPGSTIISNDGDFIKKNPSSSIESVSNLLNMLLSDILVSRLQGDRRVGIASIV